MRSPSRGPGLPRTSEEVLSHGCAAASDRRPGTPRSGESGAYSGGSFSVMLGDSGSTYPEPGVIQLPAEAHLFKAAGRGGDLSGGEIFIGTLSLEAACCSCGP